jgi:hypothetical protein
MPNFHCMIARRSMFAVTVGVLVAALAGSAAADDWETYQHDPQHTGLAGVGPNPLTLNLSWSAPAGFSTPLIVGHSVYALQNGQGTSSQTQIASFNLATGHQNWDVVGNYLFPSQEAYAGGYIVFADTGELYVLNAATGAQVYTVAIPEWYSSTLTAATDPTTSQPVVYVTDAYNTSAVRLGTSGSLLWTAAVGFSGGVPSVMGNRLLVANPNQYYAFDRSTGAGNHFYNGPSTGVGAATPVVDVVRNQFYVEQLYGGTTMALTAYSNNNGAINQIWQDTGEGIYNGGVALGSDGKLYSADRSSLVEIDPINGQILRSVTGHFAAGNAPIVSDGYVWEFGPGGPGILNDTLVYRLSDLSLVATFPGTRESLNTPYDGIGALDDTHLIIDYGDIVGSPGFDVYSASAIPEPAAGSVLSLSVVIIGLRRRRTLLQ